MESTSSAETSPTRVRLNTSENQRAPSASYRRQQNVFPSRLESVFGQIQRRDDVDIICETENTSGAVNVNSVSHVWPVPNTTVETEASSACSSSTRNGEDHKTQSNAEGKRTTLSRKIKGRSRRRAMDVGGAIVNQKAGTSKSTHATLTVRGNGSKAGERRMQNEQRKRHDFELGETDPFSLRAANSVSEKVVIIRNAHSAPTSSTKQERMSKGSTKPERMFGKRLSRDRNCTIEKPVNDHACNSRISSHPERNTIRNESDQVEPNRQDAASREPVENRRKLGLSDLAKMIKENRRSQSDVSEAEGNVTDGNQSQSDVEQEAREGLKGSLVALAAVKFRDGSQNILLKSLALLRLIILFGYYSLLTPFYVGEGNGVFIAKRNFLQMTLAVVLLTTSIVWKTLKVVHIASSMPSLGTEPSVFFEGIQQIMELTIVTTFSYCVILNYNHFPHIYYGSNPRKVKQVINKWMIFAVSLLLSAICIGLSFWEAFGKDWRANFPLTYVLQKVTQDFQIHLTIILPSFEEYDLPTDIGWFAICLELHQKFLLAYIEILMWTIALAVFTAIGEAKRICYRESSASIITKATRVYRGLSHFVESSNKAIGPLTFAYYMQLTPLGVCTFVLILARQNIGNSTVASPMRMRDYVYILVAVCFILLKIGHVLLAAQFHRKVSKFASQVLQESMKANLSQYALTNNQQTRIVLQMENERKIREFDVLSSEPLGLTGMGFFKVSFSLVTAIIFSVIQFTLFIVEIQSGNSGKKGVGAIG